MERQLYSVSRLNREVRLLLDHGMPVIWVEGEISNFSRPSSGHWYFSLKDRDAQIRCAMFRTRNSATKFTPREGTSVVARGRVSLYEPRGDFQLIVEHLEEGGLGQLKREFERLKTQLAAEGLFDPARKRTLPAVPRTIGVVTSPTGAAIRDILHVLARRFPAAHVIVYPSAVQGAASAPELRAAIERACARHECDVLIVARGGGSLEDLWAFNDERVARALRACPMPVVSGVGHEIDFTIADFVADVRAPTPSGAAELVVPDRQVWLEAYARLERRFATAVLRQARDCGLRFGELARRLDLVHPAVRLRQAAQRLDELEQRLARSIAADGWQRRSRWSELCTRLSQASPAARLHDHVSTHASLSQRLAHAMHGELARAAHRAHVAQRTLDAVSPLATLDRGFSIVTRADTKDIVTDALQLEVGVAISARLARGRLSARVTTIEPTESTDLEAPRKP